MKKIKKLFMTTLIAGLAVAVSGCSLLGVTPDVSEYIDPAQESAADNEELRSYLEELRPVLEAFYGEGKALKEASVKGNEIILEIDLGNDPSPYEDFEKLMVYETTRVTHSILNYRDYEEIREIYKITISYTGQKNVTLYGKQAVETEQSYDFDAKTILDAVKRG
ncbi:hypothetical protein ACHAL6_01195 [Proteiniclasticum sp. C24MP]|uniref:hypothetical protein n=1 Tax=Proteiniclasticum sp. C24MP TaxID=3374101 RepID=UPI0037540FE4